MEHADLLTAIGISIVAAAALALVARQVRQPLIIGYILLLGCFGLATDQAMKALGRRMFRYMAPR